MGWSSGCGSIGMRKLNMGLDKRMRTEYPDRALKRLGGMIDIARDPFSVLGSPLLVTKDSDRDRLTFHIARRFTTLQPGLESIQERRPVVEDFTLIDQNGAALGFRLSIHPHVLNLRTEIGDFQLAFHDGDTLAVGLPPGVRCGIEFQILPPLIQDKRDESTLQFSCQTTASLDEEEITPQKQGKKVRLVMQAGEDDAIHLRFKDRAQKQEGIPPFSQTLQHTQKRWRRWFAQIPPVSGVYEGLYCYAWWVLGNNLIDPRGWIPFRGVMPSKAKYIGIWNWDACFHALALRHLNPQLARDQLRIILAHQRADGMLPDAVHQDGVVDWIDHPFPNAVTKPPLMAWAALKIHEKDLDIEFLEEIYPQLVAWHDWWFSKTDDRGLAQYPHPYSSGLDDSPLWDYGFPVTSPDLNTYLVIQRQSLAEICRILGEEEQAAAWMKRADDLTKRMVEDLYSPELGYFRAKRGEKPIPEFTPFNLYPLWTNRLPSSMRDRLLDHLQDPSKFWSEYPLATVAMDSPSFDPFTMWRGPTWININYIFIQALSGIGEKELADQLRGRTLDLVKKSEGIFEYYHPQSGIPPAKAAPMFSWSAALCIDLILDMQHVQPGNLVP